MARLLLASVVLFSSIYSALSAVASIQSLSWNYINIGSGTQFAYLDSGAPYGWPYTTIVTLHGDGFNAGVYTQLMNTAWKYNYRIVAVNRRDYPPTTALSSNDLALLGSGVSGELAFFQARGTEIGLFLDKFIQQNYLPQAYGTSGGVVLAGWSLGCLTAHAFLANVDSLPSSTANRLNKYLHTVLQHDAGPSAMGFPNPPEYDISLWLDPSAQQRFVDFSAWARAYYNSSDINSGDISTLDFNLPTSQTPSLSELNPPNGTYYQKITNGNTFAGSDGTQVFLGLNSTAELFRRASYNATVQSYLPNTRVRYFSGGQTPGILLYGTWLVDGVNDNPASIGGVEARDVDTYRATSGNHFLFWDEPDYTLIQWSKAIAN